MRKAKQARVKKVYLKFNPLAPEYSHRLVEQREFMSKACTAACIIICVIGST